MQKLIWMENSVIICKQLEFIAAAISKKQLEHLLSGNAQSLQVCLNERKGASCHVELQVAEIEDSVKRVQRFLDIVKKFHAHQQNAIGLYDLY